MEQRGFATSKTYWIKFIWGLFIGLLAAVSVLLFNYLMNLGLKWLWPDPPGYEPFSGSLRVLIIMTVAGFLVGLLYHFIKVKETEIADALKDGRVDPKGLPGGLLVSLVSLIGGFSLGPEVPSGMLAGGLATWISEKRNLSKEIRSSNVVSSITAAYGGLFTSPLGAFLIPLEFPHMQTFNYYGTLIIAGATAVLGFVVFYVAGSDEFAGLLRILDLPMYDLLPWHLVVAIILGILGAAMALIFGLTMGALKKLVMPLKHQPVLRNTLAGFLLGLLGWALPLTLFLGSDGLEVVTDNAAQIGVALLVVYILAKILATAGALATSFVGGPIFPLFFVGGTLGTVATLLFPEIPIALSVGCGMVAVTAGILPIPMALGIYTILIVGLPITEAIPVFVAALTSFLVIRGFGLLPGPKKPAVKASELGDGESPNNIETTN
jgi:H+/Cl- antiporter ClcA